MACCILHSASCAAVLHHLCLCSTWTEPLAPAACLPAVQATADLGRAGASGLAQTAATSESITDLWEHIYSVFPGWHVLAPCQKAAPRCL